MIRTAYKFSFEQNIPNGEIRKGLMLSTIAVEAIYGESAMMTDCKFSTFERQRVCIIDAETQVGADLAKVFARFMNLYSGGCFRSEFIECKESLGDILDFCEMFIQ